MNTTQSPVDVHAELVERIDRGSSPVLAVILRADGSTPQRTGVKAVVDAEGKIYGTLGGGLVEGQAQRLAVEAYRSRRPAVHDFDLADAYAPDAGPVCGGTMRILIDPCAQRDRASYARAADALKQRERGVLITTVRGTGEPEVGAEWFPQDALPLQPGFPGADAIRACLEREAARLFVQESQHPGQHLEVLVEPVIPRPLLLIVGGGHVGQALAHQAIPVGFDVTVVDDRAEFTHPALFPEGAITRCGAPAGQVADFPITADTYVVIVTRGHRHDAEALEACIHAPAAYIGMIGSRRKVGMVRQSFIESGLATEEEFDRVFTPVGLDIGAVTVPEIATSIAAELIAVRRNRLRRPDEVPR